MHRIDLADDTFLVAEPATVAAVVADPRSVRRWFPDLRMTVAKARGVKGVQWEVDGAYVGTAEIWLEPFGDGVILHLYLRLDPADGSCPDPDAERDRRARAWKPYVWALKDDLEAGRLPGAGRVREPGPGAPWA